MTFTKVTWLTECETGQTLNFFYKAKLPNSHYRHLTLVLIQITKEVKLVGGSGPHEGNILVGGLPVCDDSHDSENALVVCRCKYQAFCFLVTWYVQDAWVSTWTAYNSIPLWKCQPYVCNGQRAMCGRWDLSPWLPPCHCRWLLGEWRGRSSLLRWLHKHKTTCPLPNFQLTWAWSLCCLLTQERSQKIGKI